MGRAKARPSEVVRYPRCRDPPRLHSFNDGISYLALEEPRRSQCGARRAAMLAVELSRRDVPEVVLDDPDPHHSRREPDRADGPGLLERDLPDLLRRLDALGVFLTERPLEQIERLGDLRVLGLHPGRAAALIPL